MTPKTTVEGMAGRSEPRASAATRAPNAPTTPQRAIAVRGRNTMARSVWARRRTYVSRPITTGAATYRIGIQRAPSTIPPGHAKSTTNPAARIRRLPTGTHDSRGSAQCVRPRGIVSTQRARSYRVSAQFPPMDIPRIDEREDLSDKEIADRIEDLRPGDRILFNDRKEPLQVTTLDSQGRVSIGENLSGIEVKGQRTRYILSSDELMYHPKSGVVRRSLFWIQRLG